MSDQFGNAATQSCDSTGEHISPWLFPSIPEKINFPNQYATNIQKKDEWMSLQENIEQKSISRKRALSSGNKWNYTSTANGPIISKNIFRLPLNSCDRYEVSAKIIGKGSFAKVYLGYQLGSHSLFLENNCQKESLEFEELTHLSPSIFSLKTFGSEEDISVKSKTPVAIKRISKLSVPKHIHHSLKSEIQFLKSIEPPHPNLLRLVAVTESNSHTQIITEFCDMGDLHSFMKGSRCNSNLTFGKNENGLHPILAHHFFKCISNALEELRKHNIIHRDLKPHNVLLSTKTSHDLFQYSTKQYSFTQDLRQLEEIYGKLLNHRQDAIIESMKDLPWETLHDLPVAKLGDFGFARVLGEKEMADTLCGSPLYMAPEILNYEKYDAKADLWSFGTIVYEMIVGKPPYRAHNPMELLRKIKASPGIVFPDELVINTENSITEPPLMSVGDNRINSPSISPFVSRNALEEVSSLMTKEDYSTPYQPSHNSSVSPIAIPQKINRKLKTRAYTFSSNQKNFLPTPQSLISDTSSSQNCETSNGGSSSRSIVSSSKDLKNLTRALLMTKPGDRIEFDCLFAHPCSILGAELVILSKLKERHTHQTTNLGTKFNQISINRTRGLSQIYSGETCKFSNRSSPPIVDHVFHPITRQKKEPGTSNCENVGSSQSIDRIMDPVKEENFFDVNQILMPFSMELDANNANDLRSSKMSPKFSSIDADLQMESTASMISSGYEQAKESFISTKSAEKILKNPNNASFDEETHRYPAESVNKLSDPHSFEISQGFIARQIERINQFIHDTMYGELANEETGNNLKPSENSSEEEEADEDGFVFI